MKFGRFLTPELTTVAQPIKEMGKCAVQMILGTVKELPRDREMKFPVMLIKGETQRIKCRTWRTMGMKLDSSGKYKHGYDSDRLSGFR